MAALEGAALLRVLFRSLSSVSLDPDGFCLPFFLLRKLLRTWPLRTLFSPQDSPLRLPLRNKILFPSNSHRGPNPPLVIFLFSCLFWKVRELFMSSSDCSVNHPRAIRSVTDSIPIKPWCQSCCGFWEGWVLSSKWMPGEYSSAPHQCRNWSTCSLRSIFGRDPGY